MTTTQLRLMAVGRCIADIGIVIVTEQDIEACWRAQIADEIDAMPEVLDAVGPHYPMLLSDEDMAAELESLQDGIEDEDFWRKGC